MMSIEGHAIRTAAVAFTIWAGAPAVLAEPRDIYLLMGQSNMSGRGSVAELTVAERALDPRILLLGNDGRLRVAAEPLDDARGQIHVASADPRAGVGPGLFFARAMLARNGRPIVLIPCAKGGSSIHDWTSFDEADSLYTSCIARTRSVGGRIAGLLWYQGETDARDPNAFRWWPLAFRRLVARARRDLRFSGLPIVAVSLARYEPGLKPYPGWRRLQAAQSALSVKGVAIVGTKDLPLQADGLHLTTAAQRTLGARIAYVWVAAQLRTRPNLLSGTVRPNAPAGDWGWTG
jgi:hypothetical protein